ncbi:pseudouridine synthase [Caulobacter sp. KR2-114]|uniref:pseudouridine synthase n=1 Tax=Caulobacter sp. KR2-114 TaxID=3400912 RepID=UPI003C0F2D79
MAGHPPHRNRTNAKGQASTRKARLSDTPVPHASGHDPLNSALDPELHAASDDGSGDRVAKILARAGVASRREVERLIEAGRVALNGQTLTTPAVKVAAGDIVTVDGEVIGEAEPARLFRYHKPPGLVTTHNDPKGRPTVFETLPEGLPRLISIGRLDLSSEGLLLLTNDGELARALELPSNAWARRYRARARGRITQARLDTLKNGITVEGVRYGPIEATLDKVKEGRDAANLWITVTLSEGKNREVRRVLEALGVTVNRLIRLSYGPFALGTLAVGAVEEVGPRVVREQLEGLVDPANMPKGDRPQYKAPASAQSVRRLADAAREEAAMRPPEPPEKKTYKTGWAKPKIKPKAARPAKAGKGAAKLEAAKVGGKTFSAKPAVKAAGSGSAAGRPRGPLARPPSASPRQSSGARQPGPRPAGGPGRRG